ncbi:MAG: metallopeptidase TldD-related protein, partial [Candidatus Eisenbacteria bacterium]
APARGHRRYLDVDLRVGSMELDNTHEIRGGDWRDNYAGRRLVDFPIENDPASIRATLWNETEYQYRKAQERYTKVQANRQVKVAEEDQSADFSPGGAPTYNEPFTTTPVDEAAWSAILDRLGDYFTQFPFVQSSQVGLTVTDVGNCLVSSEGARLQHGNHYIRFRISIYGMAADGMALHRSVGHDAARMEHLPAADVLLADAQRLVEELRSLMDAPIVEPYIGPAILLNRASGVFFHEIFGHRIEGHRQKSESEGQTFTKKVGQTILPDFISVYDDPTLTQFAGTDLRGAYRFDSEGTPAQAVTVVEKGVLRSFLTSRSPIENFPFSNGHGRREPGHDVVARQGNLIVRSEKVVGFDELRRELIAECLRQGKPYGLVFADISGGFTMTGRGGPQAFKVNPLYVYRVYADGRPDEIVRGVDIVGTPLTSFSKIILTADDDAVFNGTCGAESGGVPVSAVSPSILVSEIEVEKRQKGQDKPPLLPPPTPPSPQGDPVFGAMQDEMDRAMTQLVMPGMTPPYFLAYWIQDNETLTIEARYGALVQTARDRERYLAAQVRVGSPALDNTEFIGGWDDLYRMRARMAEEDDYLSLRHQLWLHTDAAYKDGLETLARKQAHLQAHPPQDTLPDFVAAAAVDRIEAPARLEVDEAQWADEVREAARLLSGYRSLQDWRITYFGGAVNRRHLNSEGHRHLKGGVQHLLEVSATAQAPDGQRLTGFLRFSTRDEPIPVGGALAARVRALAEDLEAMAGAPLLDEYAGPVLFTDFAAAQFVSQLFISQLSPVRAPLAAEEWMADQMPDARLTGRLQRRVMPDFVSVRDEPAREAWGGIKLAGYQKIDDEGVASQALTLVRDGRLVDLPMGRLPTKKLSGSNGHALLLPNQWLTTGVTNLFVASRSPVEDCVKELRRICTESGNAYGLLVTRLEDPGVSNAYRWTETEGGEEELLTAPVTMYRVYADDGRREPVRGLSFDEVSIRTLRDIAALGGDEAVFNFRQPSPMSGWRQPIAIVTPSILVEEMELTARGLAREPRPLSDRPHVGVRSAQ